MRPLFLYFDFVIFELFLSDFCQWTRRHRIFKRIPVGIALKSSWLHLMSFLVVRFSLHILNGCTMMWRNLRDMHNNISSVMEFQRRWVLKSKIFSQESTNLKEKKIHLGQKSCFLRPTFFEIPQPN